MKRQWVLLAFLGLTIFLGLSGEANASLMTIGTATYEGNTYNLIYEDNSIHGDLVWLDYSNARDTWQNQMSWASNLGESLVVTLDPGYTATIDWTIGWRLPSAGDNPLGAFSQTTPEMGHLYYVSLKNLPYYEPGWGILNTGKFANLQADYYWSGTEHSNPDIAWHFGFKYGDQNISYKTYNAYALAVRPANFSAVPIPGAIWMLGAGLAAILPFRKKFRKNQ